MQLCFDASRFGLGLIETIDLAKANGLAKAEFTVDAFKAASSKEAAKEEKFLESVKEKSQSANVEIACLNLNFLLDAGSPKAVKNFHLMLKKIAKTAAAIGCKRISFWLLPGTYDNWLLNCEEALSEASNICRQLDVKLILNCSTYPSFAGKSLRFWQPLTPENWRDLLSRVPDLSLNFSPADCLWQGIDYLKILPAFIAAIDKVTATDIEVNRTITADSGLFGPLFWRYRLTGRGQIDWQHLIEALKLYDFQGFLTLNLDDEFLQDQGEDLNQAVTSAVKLLSPLARQ